MKFAQRLIKNKRRSMGFIVKAVAAALLIIIHTTVIVMLIDTHRQHLLSPIKTNEPLAPIQTDQLQRTAVQPKPSDAARAAAEPRTAFSTWRCYCARPINIHAFVGPLPQLDVDADGNILNTNESLMHLCTEAELTLLREGGGAPHTLALIGCIFENSCISLRHPSKDGVTPWDVEVFLPNATSTPSLLPQAIHQGARWFKVQKYSLSPKVFGVEHSPFHRRGATANKSDEEFFFEDVNKVRTLFVPRMLDEGSDATATWSSPSASPKSLAVHWVMLHPFNLWHQLQDGWPNLFTILRIFAVSESIIRNMTIIDGYQGMHKRQPIPAPLFINPQNMEAQLGGLTRVCYERPVLVAANVCFYDHFESRRRFRDAFMDAHLGLGAARQQEQEACSGNPPKILYLGRENNHRGIVNEDVMLRYVDVLAGLGAKVEKMVFTKTSPMREQVAVVARSNILVTPHGAGTIHAIWLPLWCGELVELINAKKFVWYASSFNERHVRSYRRQHHFYWWNKNDTDTKAQFNQAGVLDVQDFHRELRLYLLRSSSRIMRTLGWNMHFVEVHKNGTLASNADRKKLWNSE